MSSPSASDIYASAYNAGAIELSNQGWTAKIPENVKDYCARKLLSTLPENIVKELFKKLTENPKNLEKIKVSYDDSGKDSCSGASVNNSPKIKAENVNRNDDEFSIAPSEKSIDRSDCCSTTVENKNSQNLMMPQQQHNTASQNSASSNNMQNNLQNLIDNYQKINNPPQIPVNVQNNQNSPNIVNQLNSILNISDNNQINNHNHNHNQINNNNQPSNLNLR